MGHSVGLPDPVVTLVQSNTGTHRDSTPTRTFGSTPTQGNLLIAVIGGRNHNPSPMPTGWNVALQTFGRNSRTAGIYWKIAGASESTSVVFANSGRGFSTILEYSSTTGWPVNPLFNIANGASGNTPRPSGTISSMPYGVAIALFSGSGNHTTRDFTNGFVEHSYGQSGTGRTEGSGSLATRIMSGDASTDLSWAGGSATNLMGFIAGFYATVPTDTDTNDSRSATLTGSAADNSARSATLTGSAESNSSRGAILTGFGGVNDTRGAILTGGYETPQYLYSTKINTESYEVVTAILHERDVTTPSDSSIDWHLSNDGGSNWEAVTPGTEHTFSSTGSDLRWRATLNASTDRQSSPSVSEISVVWTESPGVVDDDSRSAVLRGKDSSNSTRAAVITGKLTDSDIRSATTTGKATDNSARSATTHGVDTDNDARAAIVRGKLTDNSVRSAITQGRDSADSSRSAVVTGKDSDSSSRGATLAGGVGVLDSRSATIYGQDSDGNSRSATIHGVDTDESSRRATLAGVAGKSDDERAATLRGIDSTSSQIGAVVSGQAIDNSSRGALVAGKSEDDSDRGAVLSGIETLGNSRGAWLFGITRGYFDDADTQSGWVKEDETASSWTDEISSQGGWTSEDADEVTWKEEKDNQGGWS